MLHFNPVLQHRIPQLPRVGEEFLIVPKIGHFVYYHTIYYYYDWLKRSVNQVVTKLAFNKLNTYSTNPKLDESKNHCKWPNCDCPWITFGCGFEMFSCQHPSNK